MTWWMQNEAVCIDRLGSLTIHRKRAVSSETVRDLFDQALGGAGEPLKVTRKSETRRLGPWVTKLCRAQAPLGLVRLNCRPSRYRRPWIVSWHLLNKGVGVPAPVAFIEKRSFGIIAACATVCEYLEGARTVEQYADRLVAQSAAEEEIERFLARLADSISRLVSSGAYHTDLSGKNILTRDGNSFYFIDLDSVVLNRPYSDGMRLRNHIQLYDSFCDRWDPNCLEPFLLRLLPAACDSKAWIMAVKNGQAARRARQLAIWQRQGLARGPQAQK